MKKMNGSLKNSVASLVLVASMIACSQVTEVSTTDLTQVVERDGLSFSMESIPDAVLDRLASHRVVLVGETHFLREHDELMAELLRELQARGFRQFLFEWAQMADWLLADFVDDRGLEPGWTPPLSIGGSLLTAIRDLNRTLPEEDRIEVHAIDVNLADYGGGESFRWSLGGLARHLQTPGPLADFLQGSQDISAARIQGLWTLQSELRASRSALVESWGAYWYETVLEMVEVEISSLQIRALRERDYDESVRLREGVMKRLADRRLRGCRDGTVINVGGNHAQKRRLKGTRQEWLGDYLVHRSPATGGSVIVLAVTAAEIRSVAGSGIPDFDLSASPKNELFRVMNRTWPDQVVFLPLDDPVFAEDGIPMNFEGIIYVGAPKRHYDVFLQLPLAHRLPID
jgi:hypothetical protein